MAASVGVTDARRPGVRRRRTGVLALGAAFVLAVVAACGGGAPATSTENGFRPAPQTGGTLTVWVDSTRLAAAQLYQREHPAVKMDIVTYDGDANGSNFL